VHRTPAVRLPRHPDAPDGADRDAVRQWVTNADGPTAIDLFCGAGGLSLGLRNAGFRVLVGADSDPWSVQTHEANLAGLGLHGDLSDPRALLGQLRWWGIETVDLVAGGVPCQPFSRAGRSKIRSLREQGEWGADDQRANLWNSFMMVVEALRPAAVLVENVPDLPTWDDGAVLTGFYEHLGDLGYTVDARVLDGFRYGVPQHRQRLFLIGLRGGRTPEWPPETNELVTLRDAIGDLPIVPRAMRSERFDYDSTRISSDFQRRMRADVPAADRNVVWDHLTRDVRPDDMEAFELLGEGQTYSDLPERLQRYRADIFTDKYRRLGWHELCRSITAHIAKDGYWYIHPDQHRTLSVREAARVQTFPDHFRFAGPQTHRYRQIGNAVPPLLGQAVGEAIRSALAKTPPTTVAESREGFRTDVLEWHADNARPAPWRRDPEPWHVLMGELCLQRTRTEDVSVIFGRLKELAPTPTEMYRNDERALEAMQAMGLRARAEQLIEVARHLVNHFDGEVPESELELRALPGVGDYVAQAVLCFGFGRRALLLDTNTMRISTRINARPEDRRFQLRLDLHRLAGARGPDAEFNHALIDLGALVCRAGLPRCSACPARQRCATGLALADRQLELG
jgi:DNA (cytosine-5)-methyltransferase 1